MIYIWRHWLQYLQYWNNIDKIYVIILKINIMKGDIAKEEY